MVVYLSAVRCRCRRHECVPWPALAQVVEQYFDVGVDWLLLALLCIMLFKDWSYLGPGGRSAIVASEDALWQAIELFFAAIFVVEASAKVRLIQPACLSVCLSHSAACRASARAYARFPVSPSACVRLSCHTTSRPCARPSSLWYAVFSRTSAYHSTCGRLCVQPRDH
jgi:hypothetical protein